MAKFAVCLIAVLWGAACSASDLISLGSTWQYLHPLDGVDPGALDPDFYSASGGWRADAAAFAANYDGPLFQSGPGLLGTGGIVYQDPPGTRLGFAEPGKRYSAFFRHEFRLTEPTTLLLTLQYLVDDGGVVYLDGVEILRINYPADRPDSYFEVAPTAGVEEYLTRIPLSKIAGVPTTLAAGDHVLSVSVHNVSPLNNDLGMEMRLYSGPGPRTGPAGTGFAEVSLGATEYEPAPGSAEIGFESRHDGEGAVLGIADFDGNKAFQLINGHVVLTTEPVDIEGFKDVGISIDIRSFEQDSPTDYAHGFLSARVEYSFDWMNYTTANWLFFFGFDDLKTLELPDGAFSSFTTPPDIVPAGARSVRLKIDAQNTHPNELFVIDSIHISAVPVPEPSTALLAAVGLAALVTITRRRSAK